MASAGAPAARTVFLDPGHGDSDGGAVHRDAQGEVDLREKDVNLAVALKAAELLRARGYRVVLSRETDERPGQGEDVNGDVT
jgi:N-acetylmuramoyl-L-alanine amidase